MKKTPCECMLWMGLPVIRKEIAQSLIDNFGLNQRDVAKKLGVSPPAVCQYLSRKRANIEIIDDEIIKEIDVSAERILKHGKEVCVEETCRICKIIRSNNDLFENIFDLCNKE